MDQFAGVAVAQELEEALARANAQEGEYLLLVHFPRYRLLVKWGDKPPVPVGPVGLAFYMGGGPTWRWTYVDKSGRFAALVGQEQGLEMFRDPFLRICRSLQEQGLEIEP